MSSAPPPLTHLAGLYQGQEGGLYGGGRNEPTAAHLEAARRAGARVVPRGPGGEPDQSGLIGLLSIGFSNAAQEFSEFCGLLRGEAAVSPRLCPVNGAQSHMGTAEWAVPDGVPWKVLDERLKHSAVSPAQVQVAWVKMAPSHPEALGTFPRHARQTARDLGSALRTLRGRFPNLRLAYLSSRIWAGYAVTPLSPEPFAYENAFSVRWVIEAQCRGDPGLAWEDGDSPRAPLLLWGPYLWAPGSSGGAGDGLVWTPEDFAPDGTHPSHKGARKVARLLLDFFKADATARPWFLR
jgi:hypothetical protein